MTITKDDLKRIKDETIKSRPENCVYVGYSTCGIAAGADVVYKTLVEEVKTLNLDVEIKKCGCLGLCSAEPLVEVDVEGAPHVFYGKVDEETAHPYRVMTDPGRYDIGIKATGGVSPDSYVRNASLSLNAGEFAPCIFEADPGKVYVGRSSTVTITGANLQDGASIKFSMPDHDDIKATDVSVTDSTEATCKVAFDPSDAGKWDATVTNPDSQSYKLDDALSADPYSVYLAEGSTLWQQNCSEYITVQNPNDSAVNVSITYMTTDGKKAGPTVNMPAESQATINPAETLGRADFSTKVSCTEGLPISADRTMIWNAGAGEEAHCSVAVTEPDTVWYMPEGSSKWGFETWTLIQNPNDATANVTLTYMIEGSSPVTRTKTVGANSRASFSMADDIGEQDASIKVTSDTSVITERAVYRNSRREGSCSAGTTTPASDYYLAEGTTGWGFTTYVLVQNPNETATEVTLTYMTADGAKPQDPITLPANSRKTICVNDIAEMADTDFSTQVHGSSPIIAERALYWGSGSQQVCHDSIGMSEGHTSFYFPDGETTNGRETYTLVQNPNDTDVTVEVTYMMPDGTGNVTKTETIPANSRRTFNMAEHSSISGRAAIRVTCTTAGKKIMCERAMYWNNRGAGTDTIGGYGD